MTNIVICVDDTVVGAVQTCEIKETAPHEDKQYPVGWCGRVRFDRTKIEEIFLRGFVHAKSQKIPFDIKIDDEIIKNVWIKKTGATYITGDFVIIDEMEWEAEDILYN